MVAAMILVGAASYALQRGRLPEWDTLPQREAWLGLKIDRVFVSADPSKVTGLATVVRSEGHVRELEGQRIYFFGLFEKRRNGSVAHGGGGSRRRLNDLGAKSSGGHV